MNILHFSDSIGENPEASRLHMNYYPLFQTPESKTYIASAGLTSEELADLNYEDNITPFIQPNYLPALEVKSLEYYFKFNENLSDAMLSEIADEFSNSLLGEVDEEITAKFRTFAHAYFKQHLAIFYNCFRNSNLNPEDYPSITLRDLISSIGQDTHTYFYGDNLRNSRYHTEKIVSAQPLIEQFKFLSVDDNSLLKGYLDEKGAFWFKTVISKDYALPSNALTNMGNPRNITALLLRNKEFVKLFESKKGFRTKDTLIEGVGTKEQKMLRLAEKIDHVIDSILDKDIVLFRSLEEVNNAAVDRKVNSITTKIDVYMNDLKNESDSSIQASLKRLINYELNSEYLSEEQKDDIRKQLGLILEEQ